MRQKILAETEAAKTLTRMLAARAQHIHRRDKARLLRKLLDRIMTEVKEAQEEESLAEYAFTRGRLISGGLGFIGGIVGAAINGNENPLRAGARIAGRSLSAISTFGKVLVAVRIKGSCLDEVKVIELSKLARESGKAECQVRTALENQGYLLWTPEHFSKVIGDLEQDALNGTLNMLVTDMHVVSASNPGWKPVVVGKVVELYDQRRPNTP